MVRVGMWFWISCVRGRGWRDLYIRHTTKRVKEYLLPIGKESYIGSRYDFGLFITCDLHDYNGLGLTRWHRPSKTRGLSLLFSSSSSLLLLLLIIIIFLPFFAVKLPTCHATKRHD